MTSSLKNKNMENKKELIIISDERIIGRILIIRGRKVIVDRDLAGLYEIKSIVCS